MSISLTSVGLDQLLADLQHHGYQGTRQYLEHLVLKASSRSGMGLLEAGLEQLLTDKRFEEESIQSFRQVVDFWKKRFHYATVRIDHNFRFDILFWKPIDDTQIQESARFHLSMVSGHGEIFMKLRDMPRPERRTLQLPELKSPSISLTEPPMAEKTETDGVPASSQVSANWAGALLTAGYADGLGGELGIIEQGPIPYTD